MIFQKKLSKFGLVSAICLGAGIGFVNGAQAQKKEARPRKEAGQTKASPVVDEGRLKMDLDRIMEYPPPDRIKRLRFFIRSHPNSSLIPTATEALNAALVENGEAKVETPPKKTDEATTTTTAPAIPSATPAADSATTTTATPLAAPSATSESKPENTENKLAAEKANESAKASEPSEKKPTEVTNGTKNSAPLERLLDQPVEVRIGKLRAFLETNPDAAQAQTATESLIAALAEDGDAKLKAGDAAGGLQQFRGALDLLPAHLSDKLFSGVVARIPTNLFVRGETSAAIDAARTIETKIKGEAPRLLLLATFYLSVEQGDDAARLAQQAVNLAPDMATAHQALGAAYHVGLRLDDAALEYARALELNPKLASARRSLADLRRATGKPEEALALYREQIAAEPKDLAARAGMVLSLFAAGKNEDAERELSAALQDEPRNLPLVVGAAYWYAAQSDAAHALEYAQKAVGIEPRYTWAQIALARALILQKRSAEAEQALRLAKQYGRFPTLDYELANALAAGGFYDEAAAELTRSFSLEKGNLTTHLAGRQTASAADFIELLGPERRASLFQAKAAETESNARMMRGLLALHTIVAASQGGDSSVRENEIAKAAREFTANGDESTRALRQLYTAEFLLSKNTALPLVIELTDAATSGVEAALDAPSATTAILAGEIRDWRARALAAGGVPNVPALPREVLSKILRGRLEAAAGWAFFNSDKSAEAIVRLRRAASVLPENSVWWRSSFWRLGSALEASGNREEALVSYIKSYQSGAPDAGRRATIEALYRKLNGSLDGLDARLGAAITNGPNGVSDSGTLAPTATPHPTETKQQ